MPHSVTHTDITVRIQKETLLIIFMGCGGDVKFCVSRSCKKTAWMFYEYIYTLWDSICFNYLNMF